MKLPRDPGEREIRNRTQAASWLGVARSRLAPLLQGDIVGIASRDDGRPGGEANDCR